METKTYYASSVQAAMEVARRELGPDAMLVNSGPAPAAARQFGRMEVTFAWDACSAGGKSAMAATASAQVSELRAAFGRLPGSGADLQSLGGKTPGIENVVQLLCTAGFEKEIAQEIAESAAKDGVRTSDGIVRELTARIPVAAFSPPQVKETKTLAFVGPPGRGKTSSLVKVAVRYGLANRIPTRIYLAGAHGVGAVEQMGRYASILGLPFESLESFESLHLLLERSRWKGLVFIDTPGTVCGDQEEMSAMTKFFERRSDIERHLVLRAEARSADMQYMLARFAAIQPSRLLFTGIDEARSLGAAAETMIRSGVATTFFGTGPQTPDDIEEIDLAKLVRTLWSVNRLAARAA